MASSSKAFTYVSGTKVDTAWVMRRRWARAGLMYFLLIFFAILFMGPLLVALFARFTGDSRQTILSLLLLIVVGAWFLKKVKFGL